MMSKDIQYNSNFLSSLLPVVLLGMIANSPALAYELIDLGENVEPKAINNMGVIAGSSNTMVSPFTNGCSKRRNSWKNTGRLAAFSHS